MILDALVGLLLDFLGFFLALFPTWTDPVDWSSNPPPDSIGAAFEVGRKLSFMDPWVPVELTQTLVGILIAAWLTVVTVKGIVWLYDRIPFKAS